jgi:hypothetical protein
MGKRSAVVELFLGDMGSCGSRGRATASGDPVGEEKSSSLPRPGRDDKRYRFDLGQAGMGKVLDLWLYWWNQQTEASQPITVRKAD